ncbi:hypothetical protein Anapl_04867 [Anas platyrhynchos]|uniref:Uncharacterized protein n=1 Tax=Anas platyrhynchos TaxID=8839 RepID=R0LY90_ANAPL|nr:hypothetical protein Anapl_04867 [Anas platyrhynchos]
MRTEFVSSNHTGNQYQLSVRLQTVTFTMKKRPLIQQDASVEFLDISSDYSDDFSAFANFMLCQHRSMQSTKKRADEIGHMKYPFETVTEPQHLFGSKTPSAPPKPFAYIFVINLNQLDTLWPRANPDIAITKAIAFLSDGARRHEHKSPNAPHAAETTVANATRVPSIPPSSVIHSVANHATSLAKEEAGDATPSTRAGKAEKNQTAALPSIHLQTDAATNRAENVSGPPPPRCCRAAPAASPLSCGAPQPQPRTAPSCPETRGKGRLDPRSLGGKTTRCKAKPRIEGEGIALLPGSCVPRPPSRRERGAAPAVPHLGTARGESPTLPALPSPPPPLPALRRFQPPDLVPCLQQHEIMGAGCGCVKGRGRAVGVQKPFYTFRVRLEQNLLQFAGGLSNSHGDDRKSQSLLNCVGLGKNEKGISPRLCSAQDVLHPRRGERRRP